MTAAVKAASHIGTTYVAAAAEVCSRFIGTCRELSPPPFPFPPPFFLCFLGFPEWNIQDHPFLSLVCPWTIVRSWEHLPFSPLPFSPSLFLSFSLSSLYPLPWVSLDAFVIAGSPSFLVCPWTLVSYSVSFFLSLSFLPPPPPSFLARGVFTSKLGFCNRFF